MRSLLAQAQVIRREPHHFHAGPFVDRFELRLQRHQLVTRKDARGRFDGAEAAGIVWQDTHELRRHAVRGQLVVARDALDVEKLVLGGHVRHGQDLDAVLLAVRRVHEQVAEVARSLAVAHGLAQVVHVLRVGGGVRHVENETGMRAVLVVLAAEQGGRLVEPGRLQRAQVLRHAVQFLIHVRLHQVEHAALVELVHGLVAVDEIIGIQIDAAPHVLGQGVLVRQRLAAAAGPVFQVGIAERQEVQGHALEGVARQVFAGDQGGRQHVGLEVDRAAVVHASIKGLGQAGQIDGRLVPVTVLPAFEAVENVGVLEHGRGIAERKRLDAGGGRRRGRGRCWWCALGLPAARAHVSCFSQE